MYIDNDGIISSLIGTGSSFHGDLVLSGILHIDGDFTGTIESDGQIIIGAMAKVVCDIRASIVVVGGHFLGTIHASQRVFVLEQAELNGSIFSPRCIVEQGGKINGDLSILPFGAKRKISFSSQPDMQLDQLHAD